MVASLGPSRRSVFAGAAALAVVPAVPAAAAVQHLPAIWAHANALRERVNDLSTPIDEAEALLDPCYAAETRVLVEPIVGCADAAAKLRCALTYTIDDDGPAPTAAYAAVQQVIRWLEAR